ncbi:MAG: VWA domain-containing protein [Treponema sp.]|jgi:hypothetical protein|nr:VWA domain-containing protein [Treponema sp.]
MKNFWKKQICIFFTLLCFAVPIQNTAAQDTKATLTVKIDQIVSNDFPYMTIYTVVENNRGEVVTGLSPGLFSFRIDSLEERGKTSIIPFSMREAPIDYTIIFSNNGIMEGEPLDFQKNAILQFIETMKETDRLSLYTIGEEASVVFEELRKDAIDPSVINAVDVTSVQPRVYDSIINVMRKVQRRNLERKIVIIISDGRDQNSRFTKEQLNTVLKEVEAPVYALGIRVLNTQSLSNLNEMAELTGGTYLYTSRLSDIPGNLKTLYGKITQPYVINIKVKSLKADDLHHVFEVSINERDASGKGQKTFVAVKVPVPRWVRWVIVAVILVVIAALIVFYIIHKTIKRKRMGITKRRCPECHNRMKDTWDTCPFCRYMPDIKKKKKRKKDG